MSIRRAPRKTTYTNIDNAVFNAGLSYRAMGLLCFLLSKPDHWEVSTTHLINSTKSSANPLGKDAIYSILKELKDAGFVTAEQTRRESGKMGKMDYVIHDTPQQSQPEADKPEAANPPQVNTESLVTTKVEVTTEQKDSSSSDDVSADVREVFDFWKQRMGKANNTKLTAVRRKKIISRLRDGYTMEDLKLAIVNCSKSEFHMGKNDSGTAHNDIELICRSDDKLEWFMHSVCARPQSTRTKRTIDDIVTDPTTDYAEGLGRCADGSYEITDEFLFGRG